MVADVYLLNRERIFVHFSTQRVLFVDGKHTLTFCHHQDDFHKPRGHALFSSLGRRMSRSLVTSNVVLCLFIVFRSFAHLYAVDIEKLLKFALCQKKSRFVYAP